MKVLCLIIFILGLLTINARGQDNNELKFILKNNNICPNNSVAPKTTQMKKLENFNETKFLFLGLIKVYQQFISSQQSPQICVFTPSCSHFGQTAIKKYGLFFGSLMTSDRLQRCNGFAMKYYKVNYQTGKCFDGVDQYYVGRGK